MISTDLGTDSITNWQKELGKCLAEFLKDDLVVGHPQHLTSALKKALKERKKRIFFLFPFPLLIGVLIFRPKDSLPNEPLSPPPAIIPVLPQKEEKAGLVPPRRDPFEGLFHSHSPVIPVPEVIP